MKDEALRRALEALERGRPQIVGVLVQQDQDNAITAIREVLAQPEQELALSGLPMVLAGAIFDFAGYLTTRDKVIKVGSTANAAPIADLVKEWADLRGLSLDDPAVLSWQETIKPGYVPASDTSQDRVDETAKQRHEQEPVALGAEWVPCVKLPVVVHVRHQRQGERHVSTREGITPVKPDDLIMRGVAGEEYPIGRELWYRTYTTNTTPPQRTWQGLTDEEVMSIVFNFDLSSLSLVAKAIESTLKEKNT